MFDFGTPFAWMHIYHDIFVFKGRKCEQKNIYKFHDDGSDIIIISERIIETSFKIFIVDFYS